MLKKDFNAVKDENQYTPIPILCKAAQIMKSIDSSVFICGQLFWKYYSIQLHLNLV
jgi:hypothetical protein